MSLHCYSHDGEMFRLQFGAAGFATKRAIESLLEDLDCRLADEIGEAAGDDFTAASQEAKEDLRSMLQSWIETHINVTRHFRVIGKIRQRTLTAEDMGEGGAS
jgi:hypothetical protein